MIVADSIKKNEILTVSFTASKMIGTSARLKHGDKIKLIDLLFGLMLPRYVYFYKYQRK
jgi:D-alanyl-D-alanine carboxypeptidase